MSNLNPIQGTPRDLDELVIKIMHTPGFLIKEKAPAMIQDFLAQKFTVAMMKASSDEDMVIAYQKLFDNIVSKHPEEDHEDYRR